MKIIQLTAENVKRLTAVQITPDGNMVQITGRNGQGKTSVLDCIWWALAGAGAIQGKPIRDGEDSGRIELKLGDAGVVKLIVERRFTQANAARGGILSVRTEDGVQYPRPREFLDDLLGALTFDPLGFMRDKPAEQLNILRGLVKLDVDVDALDAANVKDFASRTTLNRDAKARRAQAAGIDVPAETPTEPVDEEAILDAMQKASDANVALARLKSDRQIRADGVVAMRNIAAKYRSDAAEMVARAVIHEAEADEYERKLAEAPALAEPVDIPNTFRKQMDAAKAVNAAIAQRRRREDLEREAAGLTDKADALTALIERRTERKAEAMSRATMPIAGLSFGEGEVVFRGLPLNQASDAEQLMVSTAIAAALSPELRVIRIRDGSLLDDKSLAWLAKFADERDMQIWIEIVGTERVGFEMEDGHLKLRAAETEKST